MRESSTFTTAIAASRFLSKPPTSALRPVRALKMVVLPARANPTNPTFMFVSIPYGAYDLPARAEPAKANFHMEGPNFLWSGLRVLIQSAAAAHHLAGDEARLVAYQEQRQVGDVLRL